MAYDVSALGLWLVAALAVGLIVGWRERAVVWPLAGAARTAAIVWAVALVATLLHVLRGRAGFYVESAVLFVAAYGVGAGAGGALRGAGAAV